MNLDKMARAILEADADLKGEWQTDIYINPSDAAEMYYASGGCRPEVELAVGSVHRLLGKRAVISDLPKGVAYVGRQVDVNPKPCPTCGQDVE